MVGRAQASAGQIFGVAGRRFGVPAGRQTLAPQNGAADTYLRLATQNGAAGT